MDTKDIFEQMTVISKAGAYDVLVKQRDELMQENRRLRSALSMIKDWAGNLPDDRLTSKTGPNDAALRGGMVVAMRQIAEETLKTIQ